MRSSNNSLTVHWSGPNPTDRPRGAVSFFYWGARNQTPEQVDEILERWRTTKKTKASSRVTLLHQNSRYGARRARRDGTSPRQDGTSPRRDGTSPRRDGTSPRRDGTRPVPYGGSRCPRNVLFITADQWRAECLSCLGHLVDTPNLDALAAEGVLFTNHFANHRALRSVPGKHAHRRLPVRARRYVQTTCRSLPGTANWALEPKARRAGLDPVLFGYTGHDLG